MSLLKSLYLCKIELWIVSIQNDHQAWKGNKAEINVKRANVASLHHLHSFYNGHHYQYSACLFCQQWRLWVAQKVLVLWRRHWCVFHEIKKRCTKSLGFRPVNCWSSMSVTFDSRSGSHGSNNRSPIPGYSFVFLYLSMYLCYSISRPILGTYFDDSFPSFRPVKFEKTPSLGVTIFRRFL